MQEMTWTDTGGNSVKGICKLFDGEHVACNTDEKRD